MTDDNMEQNQGSSNMDVSPDGVGMQSSPTEPIQPMPQPEQPVPPADNWPSPNEGALASPPETTAPSPVPTPDAVPPAMNGGEPASNYTDSFLGGGNQIKPPLPSTLPTPDQAGPTGQGMPEGGQPSQDMGMPPSPPEPNAPDGQGMPEAQGQPGSFDQIYNETQTKKRSGLWLLIVIIALVVIAALVYILFLLPASKNTTTNSTTPVGTLTTGTASSSTTTSSQTANDTRRQSDLTTIQTALEQYFIKTGSYPVSAEVSKTQDSTNPLSVLVPDYIATLPIDPQSPQDYYGYKSADGKTYELSAIFTSKPTGINSTQLEKGYLVVLTPGVTFATSQ